MTLQVHQALTKKPLKSEQKSIQFLSSNPGLPQQPLQALVILWTRLTSCSPWPVSQTVLSRLSGVVFPILFNQFNGFWTRFQAEQLETGKTSQNCPWPKQLAGGWKALSAVRSGPASSAPPPNHQRFRMLSMAKLNHNHDFCDFRRNVLFSHRQTETTTNQILFIKYINIYKQTNVSESWITVCITGILLKVTHLLSCFFRTLFQLFLSFLGLFDLKQMRTKGCWHEASPDEFGLCCWTESALLAVVLQQFLRHTILIQEWLMLWPEAGTTRSSSSIFCRLAFSSSFSDSSASWRFLHRSWRINATGQNYSDD